MASKERAEKWYGPKKPEPIGTVTSRKDPADFETPEKAKKALKEMDAAQRTGRDGDVAPGSQQLFRDGSKGPLNITPKPIKGAADKTKRRIGARAYEESDED